MIFPLTPHSLLSLHARMKKKERMPRLRQSLRAEAMQGRARCVQAVLTLEEHKRLRVMCIALNQSIGDFVRAALLQRMAEYDKDAPNKAAG